MNILECGYFVRCEVKLSGYVGMGHLWFKWVDTYGLNGWDMHIWHRWGSYGKVSYCFLGGVVPFNERKGSSAKTQLTLNTQLPWKSLCP